MRIVVIGAGALGGLVGAKLHLADEHVIMVDTDHDRVKLLNETGLFISEVEKEELCVPISVIPSCEGLDKADLIFISVKSYQTEEATRSALPLLGPETLILSMQNGIGNTDTMAEITGPERILCGITYHSIQHTGSNRLRFRPGIKPIQIAPYDGNVTPGIEAVGEVFQRAGLETDIAENIDNVIWQKLLHNAVVNPVSAITGLNCRELLDDEHLQQLMRDLCTEITEVMKARGLTIVDEEDPYRPVINSQKALWENRPTMWQDLDRGFLTEVDAINGAVVVEAERLGLSAPINKALVQLVHSHEQHSTPGRQQ